MGRGVKLGCQPTIEQIVLFNVINIGTSTANEAIHAVLNGPNMTKKMMNCSIPFFQIFTKK